MAKRKPITLGPTGRYGERMTIQWTGPSRPGKYVGYIRLEDEAGTYWGSPSEKQLRQLYGWLRMHFEHK